MKTKKLLKILITVVVMSLLVCFAFTSLAEDENKETAGLRGGVSYENGKFKIEGEVVAGVGVDGSIEVDFSEALETLNRVDQDLLGTLRPINLLPF